MYSAINSISQNDAAANAFSIANHCGNITQAAHKDYEDTALLTAITFFSIVTTALGVGALVNFSAGLLAGLPPFCLFLMNVQTNSNIDWTNHQVQQIKSKFPGKFNLHNHHTPNHPTSKHEKSRDYYNNNGFANYPAYSKKHSKDYLQSDLHTDASDQLEGFVSSDSNKLVPLSPTK